MRALYSGIVYDQPPLRGLSVRSAIDYTYEVGQEVRIEAFEALPLPGIPVDEALRLSLRLYKGEQAVIITPAPYEFRRPLIEKARYVILDGRRVNRNESSRLRYLPEYIKRKIVGFLGVPKEFILPLLLSGVDVVFDEDDEVYRLDINSFEEAWKRFVIISEENPIALRFLRLLNRSTAYHDELIKGSLTALERPEIAHRLERLSSVYEPPEADVLILLPCAAKKPYSLSKTHRPIIEVTKRYRVHELIVTSPVILVPRELETIFPAVRYDHPPTGKRTYAEKGAIADVLGALLKKYESYGYKHVIAFLPEDYKDALDLLSYPIEIYPGKKLDVKRLKRKLEELSSNGILREGSWDRKTMAKNALSFMYGTSPPDNVSRYVDRIAIGSDTFGVWKEGVLRPRKPMLEWLYSEGIYVKAPSEHIRDISEISGDAIAGLYVPRYRKQLRSLRLGLHMRQIRKLIDAGIDGIYSR